MPSLSEKQARFMRAVAHGMRPRGGHGPSMSVAREFMREDMKRRHRSLADRQRGGK